MTKTNGSSQSLIEAVSRRQADKETGMNYRVAQGDLLDQDVDVIVNAWNRNIIP